MVKDMISLENILSNGMNPENANNLVYAAKGLLVVGNIYNDSLFNETVNLAKENELLMVYNSSLDDMKTEVQTQLGLVSPQDMIMDYVSSKLSATDFQSYELMVEAIKFGGIENLLETVSPEKRKDIDGKLKYAQSELFQKRLKNIENSMKVDIGNDLNEAVLYDSALMELMAHKTAQNLAQHDTKMIITDPILAALTKEYGRRNNYDENNYININSQRGSFKLTNDLKDFYIGSNMYDSKNGSLGVSIMNSGLMGFNDKSLEANLGIISNSRMEGPNPETIEKTGIMTFNDNYGVSFDGDKIGIIEYKNQNILQNPDYLKAKLDQMVKTYSGKYFKKAA